MHKAIRETGVRGAKRGGETAGHVGASEGSEVGAIKLHMPGIENGLVVLAGKVIVGVGVGVHPVIFIVKPDVLSDERVLAGGRCEVNQRLLGPGDDRVEKRRHLRRIIALRAELVQCFEQVHPYLICVGVVVQVHIKHIDVRHHHLFDLTLPPIRLPRPVRAALQWTPRAAQLSAR